MKLCVFGEEEETAASSKRREEHCIHMLPKRCQCVYVGLNCVDHTPPLPHCHQS